MSRLRLCTTSGSKIELNTTRGWSRWPLQEMSSWILRRWPALLSRTPMTVVVGQLIWKSILSNRELSNLQYTSLARLPTSTQSGPAALVRPPLPSLICFDCHHLMRLPVALPSACLASFFICSASFFGGPSLEGERLPVALPPLHNEEDHH